MTNEKIAINPVANNPLLSRADVERAFSKVLQPRLAILDVSDVVRATLESGFDPASNERVLESLERFYLGEGWYRDGQHRRVDPHMVAEVHCRGLLMARLQGNDSPRFSTHRSRARAFAQTFRYWFDANGGVVALRQPDDRYFTSGAFWGALAFVNEEALPWGEIKGQYLRYLRWYLKLAGGASPAPHAFLPLALPETHPFWKAAPRLAPGALSPQMTPGMVLFETEGNVVALSTGQEASQGPGEEHYARFAYTSRYGFGPGDGGQEFGDAALDGMIGFSEDGRDYRARASNEEALIAGDCLYALWKPWDDVTVETWLVPEPPWHMRVHRVTSSRALVTSEGGFAIAVSGTGDDDQERPGAALARSEGDLSVVVDLSEGSRRAGTIYRSGPGAAGTAVPQLRGNLPAGMTVLASAVLALPRSSDAEADAAHPPEAPSLFALEALFKVRGRRVSVFDIGA